MRDGSVSKPVSFPLFFYYESISERVCKVCKLSIRTQRVGVWLDAMQPAASGVHHLEVSAIRRSGGLSAPLRVLQNGDGWMRLHSPGF